MREIANRQSIEAFMHALAREADQDVAVYLVGGTSAVLLGWRNSTRDIDLVMRPESDRLLRAIPALKERLHLNVELAAPDQFVPVPAGWESRSPLVTQIGRATFRHYDLYAQALAKVERGHTQDLADPGDLLVRARLTLAVALLERPRLYPPMVVASTVRASRRTWTSGSTGPARVSTRTAPWVRSPSRAERMPRITSTRSSVVAGIRRRSSQPG